MSYLLIGMLGFSLLKTLAMDPPESAIQGDLRRAARTGTAADIQRLVDADVDIFALGARHNSLMAWPALLSPLKEAINPLLNLDDAAYKTKIEVIVNAMIIRNRELAGKNMATLCQWIEMLINGFEPNPVTSEGHPVNTHLGQVRALLLEKMLPLAQVKLLELLQRETTYDIEEFLSKCSNIGFNDPHSLNVSHLFLATVNGRSILQLIVNFEITVQECEDKLTFVIRKMKLHDQNHLLKLIEVADAQFESQWRNQWRQLTDREIRVRKVVINELCYVRGEIIEAAQKYFKKVDAELSRARVNDLRRGDERISYEERLRADLTRIDDILINLGAETPTASQRELEYARLIQPQIAEHRVTNPPAGIAGQSKSIFAVLSGY